MKASHIARWLTTRPVHCSKDVIFWEKKLEQKGEGGREGGRRERKRGGEGGRERDT